MSGRGRITALRRLLRLRAQRVETARRVVALAQDALARAEAALRTREAATAALGRDIQTLDEWFASGAGGDARLIEGALSRRGLIVDRRTAEAEAREEDLRQVVEAVAARDEALRALMRATARHDAVDDQLRRAVALRAGQREEREHSEFEDRGRPRLQLVMGGRA
jgi:hypothetical protein